jgi:predicted HicB family RNase H-like nuclease
MKIDNKVGLTIRVDKEIYEKFVELADKDRRSLSNWIITTCLKKIEEK